MLNCINYTNKKEFYFTSPQTWILWAVIDLHDYLMFFLINIFIIVVVFTCVCLYYQQNIFKRSKYFEYSKYIFSMYNKYKLESFNHAPVLEFFWTITPTIMLFFMGWPSFKVLYAMEQLIDPIHTVVILGNQWYWTYHYSDYDIVSDLIQQLDSNFVLETFFLDIIDIKNANFGFKNINKKKLFQSMSKYLRKFEESKIIFDCVILSDENLPKGYPRLLSTDQVLVLPAYVSIRLLVTSLDVIHSWALPSHGVKMDAIPGRINQINFFTQTVGTYWGQCSELCGINHGFMPIEVRVMFLDDYLSFLSPNISYRQDKLIAIAEKFILAFIKRENQKVIESIYIKNLENFFEIY